MWDITENISASTAPEQVWAVVTNVADHAELAGSGEIRALRLSGPICSGATWEADIAVPGLDEPFVSRSEVVEFNKPSAFSWTSVPRPVIPDEPRSIPEVRWWFTLAPVDGSGTAVVHRVVVSPPKVGADDLARFFAETDRVETIRQGMRATLERLKARVEGPR